MVAYPKTRCTYDDVLALGDEAHVELIRGHLVEKAAPLFDHGHAQAATITWAGQHFRRGHGDRDRDWLFGSEVDVELSVDTVVRPDIGGWRRERLPRGRWKDFPTSIANSISFAGSGSGSSGDRFASGVTSRRAIGAAFVPRRVAGVPPQIASARIEIAFDDREVAFEAKELARESNGRRLRGPSVVTGTIARIRAAPAVLSASVNASSLPRERVRGDDDAPSERRPHCCAAYPA
ncbi:MAG: Uma2 family endonuclease [Myxococcales bacterium]|nr:Uma2 family endonuclease [Myxococcales bacterium]